MAAKNDNRVKVLKLIVLVNAFVSIALIALMLNGRAKAERLNNQLIDVSKMSNTLTE